MVADRVIRLQEGMSTVGAQLQDILKRVADNETRQNRLKEAYSQLEKRLAALEHRPPTERIVETNEEEFLKLLREQLDPKSSGLYPMEQRVLYCMYVKYMSHEEVAIELDLDLEAAGEIHLCAIEKLQLLHEHGRDAD